MSKSFEQIFNEHYQLPKLGVPKGEFLARLGDYLLAMDDGLWSAGDWSSFNETASWGHNHDFGEGHFVPGKMENRHLRIADYFRAAKYLSDNLRNKRIFVVGCYTGGDALLLAALGGRVVACEKHRLYAEIANFLAESFRASVFVHHGNFLHFIFDEAAYDIVYCAGVIYHVTDILGAIGRMQFLLKPGGELLLETMVTEEDGCFLAYHGKQVPGWNWLLPTPEAVIRMLEDFGFCDIDHFHSEPNSRASFYARRRG